MILSPASPPGGLPGYTEAPLRGPSVPALRWAVVGTGPIAASWIQAVRAATDQRVVAIGSRDRERAITFARKHAPEAAGGLVHEALAFEEVDAVYVAVPHTAHAAVAVAAAEAGRHVLVEKPIADSVAGAERIAAAAAEAGVFAMEAMWTCFHPWTAVAVAAIDDGLIGRVRAVAADVGRRFDFAPESRLFDPALGGGALLDLGVYAVWFALRFGGRPQKLRALGTVGPTGVEEQASLVMVGPDDVLMTVTTTMSAFTPSRGIIAGEGGSLIVDGRFASPSPLLLLDRDNRIVERFDDPTGLVGHSALAREAVRVAECVASGLTEAPEHPLSTSIAQLQVIDEARHLILWR
ncbi:MAG: Gfo/Idh/MocA family oxidoreductase [Protaetiibacter sp.]